MARALALHARGREFESHWVHQNNFRGYHYKYNGSTNYYVYLEILTDMYLLVISAEMYLL